jgi:hypothetical protein
MAVEKVGGGQTQWPAGHLVSYCLSQVDGAPPWPYKYPPTDESRHTHTHHILEILLAKLPFLV